MPGRINMAGIQKDTQLHLEGMETGLQAILVLCVSLCRSLNARFP